MGVSLKMYRVRIGTFNQSVMTSTGQNKSGATCDKIWNFKTKITVVIFFGIFSLLTYNCQNELSQSPSQSRIIYTPAPLIYDSIPASQWNSVPWPLPFSTSTLLWDTIWATSGSLWSSCRISHRKHNKLIKSINGNRGHKGHGIKLAHWNKGPGYLTNSHTEVETIISKHQPHLLGLSEANLKVSHDLSLVQHSDYHLHTCATITNPGLAISRVVAYTHKSLIVKRREDLDDDSISAIWLEVGLPRHKKIIVCQAYREWGYLGQGAGDNSGTTQAQLERWTIFLDKWEAALNEGKEVIIMMDANLDFLKWTRTDLPANDHTVRLKPLIELLFTRIFPHGVSQLVTTATRAWPGQVESGLDHIYSNKPDKLSNVESEYTGMSDHKIIKVSRFSKSLRRNVRYIRKRSYKHFSADKFLRAIQELSWWDIYTSEDANTAASLLTIKINTILDKLAPIKTFQVRNKYAPWISDTTKNMIQQRNEAQKVAVESNNMDDWRQYKNLRNTVKSRVRNEKKYWEKGKLDSTRHNPSMLWQSIKGWLNWNNSGPPSQLFYLGRMITSPSGLATTMNTFFKDKVNMLRHSIRASDADPLARLRESMENRECTMKLRPVKPAQVLQIVKGLKNSNSTGIDFLDTAIIKLAAKEILPALTHVVNLSLSQSTFPDIWKHAKVVPLLKKNDPLIPKNYRPVALLPILSKILEKVVFLQLVEYLDENKLLSPNHHGSRHSHNTATALIQMYDQWLEELEDGKLVGIMMIDLSAAFDMVDHMLLLENLKLFGLEEEVIKWFESYLLNRKQSVFIDGCLSPPLSIEYGVPQGSILGPLLYVMFTNDIPELVHKHSIAVNDQKPYCTGCGSTVCYVDDCSFSYGSKSPQQLSDELNLQYKKISEYMIANKLVINDEKTQLVVVASRQTRNLVSQVRLQAGDHPIIPSSTAKLL